MAEEPSLAELILQCKTDKYKLAYAALRWAKEIKKVENLPDPIPVVIPRGETSIAKATADGITLNGGTIIAPTDAASLAQDTSPIPPGSVRISRNDLKAILPDLNVGMRVYFY